jgi:ATP synthase F1 delta subunit
MKISTNQYAKALYETTHDKKHEEINDVVGNFIKMLVKNNQIKLAPKIIENFKKIWNKELGIIKAEVTSRGKLSEELEHKLKSYIKEKYNAEKVEINNKIDQAIKGGVIIQVGDEVLDGSIAGQLRNLKSSLEK